MKVEICLIVWTFICLKSTTCQYPEDNEGFESRAPLSYEPSGGDVAHSGSKPEAYFLHFKPHPSDYYHKQPSKFLLLLRLPEDERAGAAQKIAQAIDDSQGTFSGAQQQKADEVGFDDDAQQRIRSVSQVSQEDEQRGAPWVPNDSSKSYGSSAPVSGTKSAPVDSPILQSGYGSPVSAVKSGVGGYKSSLGQGLKSKSAGGGYGASKASSGNFGAEKGASDFGTKSGVAVSSAGGYGSGASSTAGGAAGGYGTSVTGASAGGAYGSDDGFDSSSAVGGGYGPSGGLASPVKKAFKGAAIDSGVKGGPSIKTSSVGGDYGSVSATPKSHIDYMQRTIAKAVQAAMKGADAKSSFSDYGQKKSIGTQISSPVLTDMSSLGLGLSGDYSSKGVYFANKEAVLSSPRCKCDVQDSQSALGAEGYQRAESQPGSVNIASVTDAEPKEDVSGYNDESAVSEEGKIPVIFIGLPKKKYA